VTVTAWFGWSPKRMTEGPHPFAIPNFSGPGNPFNSPILQFYGGEPILPLREQGHLPRVTERNIATVANLERSLIDDRSWLDRLASAISGFTGSIYFVLVHLVWITLWFVINTGHFFGVRKFDPYPFIFLSMIVSVEAVLLSTFVLMKQNRMAERVDQRDHLNLQIDLLAEEEITKILQLQKLICEHLQIPVASEDPAVNELAEATPIQTLAEELRRKLPKEPAA
jgi:uncharacterized membrane protein